MGKRREGEVKEGKQALETADQIAYVIDLLIAFKRPNQIRQLLADKWGLSDRTADRRIAAARQAITREVNESDRQQVVAVMMQQCLKIADEAAETRQLSNAIGALRLYGELVGVAGNHRV